MNKHYNIGILCSSMGGLYLLKEINKLLPHENILYFGDIKSNFYVNMTPKEINQKLINNLKFLAQNDCKVILISSDVLSASVDEALIKEYGIPIITFLDSAVEILGKNKYPSITILGSEKAIHNKVFLQKLLKNNKKAKINSISCDKLSSLIEKNWKECDNKDFILDDHFSLIPYDTKALLLTSPYYSFILEDIKKRFDYDILDVSEECSRELFRKLKLFNLFNPQEKQGRLEFFVSDEAEEFKIFAEKILETNINTLFKVTV